MDGLGLPGANMAAQGIGGMLGEGKAMTRDMGKKKGKKGFGKKGKKSKKGAKKGGRR